MPDTQRCADGLVSARPRQPVYGLPADVWAAGVLAYELLVGGSPFEADTKEETYDKILACRVWLPPHLSADAQDFVKQVTASTRCGRAQPVEGACHTGAWHEGLSGDPLCCALAGAAQAP